MAKEQGVAQGSSEYNEHLNDIYEHEMHHLPQAAAWTVWSSAFNVALQKPFYEMMATPRIREEFPLGNTLQRMGVKVGGASLSIGLVLGSRALFPENSHDFTNWTEETIVKPATKVFAKTIGTERKLVEQDNLLQSVV